MIVIVQHRVRDFEVWKPVFDEHAGVRKKHRATGHEVYRVVDDPNDVIVISHFPSRQQAQSFIDDPSLSQSMERAGVISAPRVTWAEEVEKVEY